MMFSNSNPRLSALSWALGQHGIRAYPENTGGGCMALVGSTPCGGELLITAGEYNADGEPGIAWSILDENGNLVTDGTARKVPEVVRSIVAGLHRRFRADKS